MSFAENEGVKKDDILKIVNEALEGLYSLIEEIEENAGKIEAFERDGVGERTIDENSPDTENHPEKQDIDVPKHISDTVITPLNEYKKSLEVEGGTTNKSKAVFNLKGLDISLEEIKQVVFADPLYGAFQDSVGEIQKNLNWEMSQLGLSSEQRER